MSDDTTVDPLRDILTQMETVERLRGVLRRLEWSDRRADGPEDWAGYARCCPACRGIDPSDRLSGSFRPESHGHQRGCYLAAALLPPESTS